MTLLEETQIEASAATPPTATLDVATEVPAEGRGRRAARFVRRNPLVVLSLAFLALLAVCVVAPGLVAPGDPGAVNTRAGLESPSLGHLFGTDQYGRDVLLRVVHGARVSILAGVIATVLAVVVGSAMGLLAGFTGRRTDTVISWLVDVMLAFPAFLLALAIVAALGTGTTNVAIAIGIAYIPFYARVVRAEVLSVRERLYIEAARASGTTTRRTLWRHVLPNVAGPILVMATVGVGTVLLAAAALSFIGLGPAPPSPEWGALITDGRRFIEHAWWISVLPGVTLLITVLAVNITGQWLRERRGPES